MATSGQDKPAKQDGDVGDATDSASGGPSQSDDADVDLCEKFAAFCDVKTKDHFTTRACNKLVKDCLEDHFKFKKVILTNRVDSSVFSKCKEKNKPHMVVNKDSCEKFLRFTAHEFAKLKTGNEKLGADDPEVGRMYDKVKDKIKKSTGPKIKTVKQSATGNVEGLTDTKKYTGSHKLRFDETGKGRGKAGRCDEAKKSGYVANYKDEGTFDEKKSKD